MAVAFAQSVDIQALVSPLAGENPGGDVRAYVRDLRAQFSELRNPPVCTNPNDPAADAAVPEPDWQAIRDLAIESLRTRTKDLRIACHFAEAQMHLAGLQGLETGLRVVLALLRDGWEYLIPEIDPEDPEVRTSPIENLLNDPDRGPCLPQSIKTLPLVGAGEQLVSYQDATRRGASDEEKNRVSLAIASMTAEEGKLLVSQVASLQSLLGELQSLLDEKLESNAPSLTNLRDAIDLIGRWLVNSFGPADASANSNILATSCGEAVERPGTVALGLVESSPKDNVLNKGVASQVPQDPVSILRLSVQMRNDAYRQLTEAATVLQQIEPHSPIPYMIHRAVRLGRMPFPDLVGKLVREESALATLRGEFGLSSEEEDA
jgi:type VI secretion system protein ImpA